MSKGSSMRRHAAFMLASLTAALAAWALAACATIEEAEQESAVLADGHAIAQAQCGSCHAVGYTDLSPREDAPPLRELSRRYRLEVLEEELMQGIKVGHPSMPEFQFSPRGTDALIGYIRHLRMANGEAPPVTE